MSSARWLSAFVLCYLGWLASPAHTQDAARPSSRSKVQLVYRAQPGCPVREVFEARLAQRLHGAARRPVVLTVDLRERSVGVDPALVAGASILGTISLTDADGVLGPRTIQAPSCSEAVDALTFVAALLLEGRAGTATDGTTRPRAPGAPTTTPRARPPSAADDAAPQARSRGGQPLVAADPAATEPSDRETERTREASGSGDAREPPATTSLVPAQPPSLPEPSQVATRTNEDSPQEQEVGAPLTESRPLRGALAVAGLIASGVAPEVRPGLALSAGLVQPLGRVFALSLGLGLRATWPHEERSAEGAGQFFWFSGAAALCAAARSAADAVRFSLCLDAEAGQLRAHGRATESPKRVGAPWLALGPAARASVRLHDRWRLVPGLGLLVPTAHDRFVVGASELHRVPQLTFRGELAVAVDWP